MFKSNDRYKRKVEWYNTAYESIINVSSACRKVLKLSSIGVTDWTNMAYSLLTGCLNAFTNLFSLLDFSSGSFSVGSSFKLKLDIKYDFKGYHWINVFSKHFLRLNFVIVKVHKLPQLVLSICTRTKVIVHVNKKSSTFADPWHYFQLTNVLNDKGNQSQTFFGHLAHFVFLKEAITLPNHRICIIRKIRYTIIPV